MSTYLRWPMGEEDEPDAYLAQCNVEIAAIDPTGSWSPPQPRDNTGQRVAPYLGPGGFLWNHEPFPEPAACVPLRSKAEMIFSVSWPSDES